MSQEAKLTRAVRRRSQKTGEWVVTPEAIDFQESALAVDAEADNEEVLLITVNDPVKLDRMQWFFALLEDRIDDIDEAEMLRLIDAAMPTLSDRPPPEAIDQARRNAKARSDFLRRHEVLEAEDVHTLYGSRAKNKAALAARWRAEGKLFAIEDGGRLVYPAFQFDTQGRPRSIIEDVLSALGDHVGSWQTALWFVSPNGWLDGARPIERLDEGARVIDAARDITEPAIY